MPSSQSTDLLRGLGLSRNPFTDRTAEKTNLDTTSLYTHSDLQGFQPSGAQHLLSICSLRLHTVPAACDPGLISALLQLLMQAFLMNCRPDVPAVWEARLWQDHHPHAGKRARA